MYAVRSKTGRVIRRFASQQAAEGYVRSLRGRTARSPGGMRLWIEKGKLIQTVNAAVGLGGMLDDLEVPYTLEFQLFEESGQPATGSYRGAGVIRKNNGQTFVILGDTDRPDAFLTEYTVAPAATEESTRKLDDFTAGIAQALAKKRVPKSASYEFRDGYTEGRKLKK